MQNIEGEGVIGFFPVVEAGTPTFVYESCSPSPALGGTMSGWFEFKYLEGPNKN